MESGKVYVNVMAEFTNDGYTCIVDGKESHLFYEDNNMQVMEERQFFNGVIPVEKISKKVTG